MASDDLRKLWQLHLIDAAILEIRKRAEALDPGRALMAEIKRLESDLESKAGVAKTLATEQLDLELRNKGIEDKLKKIDKDLYGGKVVNPREVEAFEKEVVILKRQRDENDGRLLELMDLVPPARAESEAVEKLIASRKRQLADHQKAALATKAELEREFKERSARRPAAVAALNPNLVARYDQLRKAHGGLAMASITKTAHCSECGSHLAERTIEQAKDDKLVTCDECHRLLYWTEGLI